MNWKEFYEQAKNGIMFSDGAMGTMLQDYGMTGEDCPEEWNVKYPDRITAVHRAYVEVGSQMLTTNTLGGNRIKLANYGLEKRVAELNAAGVKCAREAADSKAIVTASIGPTGKFIKPIGQMDFDEMVDIYKEQIIAMAEAGADALNFETHVDILELKAAIVAAKEVCDLPIIANMTFEKDGRTVTGTTPEAAFTLLEALGADIIGTNCSFGPAEMGLIIQRVRPLFTVPIIAQANAGIPHIHNGRTVFDEGPDSYASKAQSMVAWGGNIIGGCCGTTSEHIKLLVNVVGGCCGTTPEHIRRLREETEAGRANYLREDKPDAALKLSSRYIMKRMGFDLPFTVIGERLNPTARKKLQRDVLEGKFELLKSEALAQQAAGADILDLNMGIPGANEPELMMRAIEILSTSVELPLSLDSADAHTSRMGMRYYPGKPLLNSISYEPERLALLAEVKKYGAAFIALPVDDKGIPATAEERIRLLKKIVEQAEAAGIDKKNIVADPLVLTVSARQESAKETLKTIRRVTEELGLFTTCGLSNVSFGLPMRGFINRNFLSMAIASGLTSAIVNPLDEQIMGEVRASDVLLSKDLNSTDYIRLYAGKTETAGSITGSAENPVPAAVPDKELSLEEQLKNAVVRGSKEVIHSLVEQALAKGWKALDILNRYLIPGIMEVGELYDQRKYFLPQLMMSAETMKVAFARLESLLKEESGASKGKIVLATVKGDVHDIGKNIVAIMLQNYGYEVIDLGKDVDNAAILQAVRDNQADLIGLSALMTTTMPRMNEFMELLETEGWKTPVMIGGAAVTPDFAESIGAHYAKDAVSAVKLASRLIGGAGRLD